MKNIDYIYIYVYVYVYIYIYTWLFNVLLVHGSVVCPVRSLWNEIRLGSAYSPPGRIFYGKGKSRSRPMACVYQHRAPTAVDSGPLRMSVLAICSSTNSSSTYSPRGPFVCFSWRSVEPARPRSSFYVVHVSSSDNLVHAAVKGTYTCKEPTRVRVYIYIYIYVYI